jgi:hypothetical protein
MTLFNCMSFYLNLGSTDSDTEYRYDTIGMAILDT